MQIVNIIFLYISIGILLCLAIDYAYLQRDRGNIRFEHMPDDNFNNTERVIAILLWPVALFAAIVRLIKTNDD